MLRSMAILASVAALSLCSCGGVKFVERNLDLPANYYGYPYSGNPYAGFPNGYPSGSGYYNDYYAGYGYNHAASYDPWYSGAYDPYRSTGAFQNCDCSTYSTDNSGVRSLPAASDGTGLSRSSGATPQLDSYEVELLALPRPTGVSELLWADLKQAVREAVRAASASGAPRVYAHDPTTGGQVTDLMVEPGSTADSLHFSWTYRNDGDYDRDGTVRAADISQVGMWYGRTESDPDWVRAKVADGNHDGRISIADASVIGMNYLCQVDDYFVCVRLGDFNHDQQVDESDFSLLHDLHAGQYFATQPPDLYDRTVAEILGEPFAGDYDRFYSLGYIPLSSTLGADGRCSFDWSAQGTDLTGTPLFADVSGLAAVVVGDFENSEPTWIPYGYYTSTFHGTPLSNVVSIP